ncbi:UvrD-helicase domain-containing protein [Achromobacter insolitus]|uniref:UvrD-helicase domain-containing protein n=1 Tax=Achromobacter insolitus TaxID=217204 RepID=UPI0037C017C1
MTWLIEWARQSSLWRCRRESVLWQPSCAKCIYGCPAMLETLVSGMLESDTGAIEAPAGTGKTEQIARVASVVPGRWLVLTHTIAGRDAIRRRLERIGVSAKKAHVDTIAAWSYRWASAYPLASGLVPAAGRHLDVWLDVYLAAAKLVRSGAVNSALTASYDGLLVDEYQDCSIAQHAILSALRSILRCYIFGDPLQAIFRFNRGVASEEIVDWSAVLEEFPLHGRLQTPHRWNHANNPELGRWLLSIRETFSSGALDLQSARHLPVRWIHCEEDAIARELAAHCRVRRPAGEVLAVIDVSQAPARRAELAKYIRGTTLEPVGSTSEMKFYEDVTRATGLDRVNTVLKFAATVWQGVDASNKRKRVTSILNRPGRAANPPSEVELALCAVAQNTEILLVLDALEAVGREEKTRVVRPELLASVRSTLEMLASNPEVDMAEACWEVANRRRQMGRTVRDNAVGSTLLLKGLEFDHAVITPGACSTACDWYVALTRATRSVRVLSPSPILDFRSA